MQKIDHPFSVNTERRDSIISLFTTKKQDALFHRDKKERELEKSVALVMYYFVESSGNNFIV